jgi:hypothetical protein
VLPTIADGTNTQRRHRCLPTSSTCLSEGERSSECILISERFQHYFNGTATEKGGGLQICQAICSWQSAILSSEPAFRHQGKAGGHHGVACASRTLPWSSQWGHSLGAMIPATISVAKAELFGNGKRNCTQAHVLQCLPCELVCSFQRIPAG